MLIKKIIKNILPYFIVELYKKKSILPQHISNNVTMKTFKKDFIKKADLLSDNRFSCKWDEIWPCLNDNTDKTEFDAHYTYHPAWLSRILAKNLPKEHIDISSSISFIAYVSAFIHIKFFDYRPALMKLSNLETGFADITKLPFDDNSIESLSSMHVVEHIGLERYGDPFDPQGDIKAMKELKRVLKPGANLYFVVPVGGAMRIQYNAHRIYTYESIIDYFKPLKLVSFTLITDDAKYIENADSNLSAKQSFGCGCFWFKKELK